MQWPPLVERAGMWWVMTAEELWEQAAEDTACFLRPRGKKRFLYGNWQSSVYFIVVSEKHSQRPSDGPYSPSGPPGTANEPGASADTEVSGELWMPNHPGLLRVLLWLHFRPWNVAKDTDWPQTLICLSPVHPDLKYCPCLSISSSCSSVLRGPSLIHTFFSWFVSLVY